MRQIPPWTAVRMPGAALGLSYGGARVGRPHTCRRLNLMALSTKERATVTGCLSGEKAIKDRGSSTIRLMRKDR